MQDLIDAPEDQRLKAVTTTTLLENFSSYKLMDRIEQLSDPALCLQELVTGVTTSSANSDMHGVHHLHDSVSSAVSVNSAISGIMTSGSLGHHDSNHHGVVPHTPSLHHEPLEKLKRGEFVSFRYFE